MNQEWTSRKLNITKFKDYNIVPGNIICDWKSHGQVREQNCSLSVETLD